MEGEVLGQLPRESDDEVCAMKVECFQNFVLVDSVSKHLPLESLAAWNDVPCFSL